MDTSKGTERVNEEGAVEVKVATVDYRSPPGGGDQPPRKENVVITHITRTDDKPGTDAGVVARATAKVAEGIQSAKEHVSGKTDGTNHEKIK